MPFDGTYYTTPLANLFLEAKVRIERGWMKGDFYAGDRVCLLGAIGYDNPYAIVFGEFGLSKKSRLRRRAKNVLTQLLRSTGLTIGQWNDSYVRKRADVLALLDSAYELALTER